jgi:hypothetical protein
MVVVLKILLSRLSGVMGDIEELVEVLFDSV